MGCCYFQISHLWGRLVHGIWVNMNGCEVWGWAKTKHPPPQAQKQIALWIQMETADFKWYIGCTQSNRYSQVAYSTINENDQT